MQNFGIKNSKTSFYKKFYHSLIDVRWELQKIKIHQRNNFVLNSEEILFFIISYWFWAKNKWITKIKKYLGFNHRLLKQVIDFFDTHSELKLKSYCPFTPEFYCYFVIIWLFKYIHNYAIKCDSEEKSLIHPNCDFLLEKVMNLKLLKRDYYHLVKPCQNDSATYLKNTINLLTNKKYWLESFVSEFKNLTIKRLLKLIGRELSSISSWKNFFNEKILPLKDKNLLENTDWSNLYYLCCIGKINVNLGKTTNHVYDYFKPAISLKQENYHFMNTTNYVGDKSNLIRFEQIFSKVFCWQIIKKIRKINFKVLIVLNYFFDDKATILENFLDFLPNAKIEFLSNEVFIKIQNTKNSDLKKSYLNSINLNYYDLHFSSCIKHQEWNFIYFDSQNYHTNLMANDEKLWIQIINQIFQKN